jgi:protein-histidine N-methyltransferase
MFPTFIMQYTGPYFSGDDIEVDPNDVVPQAQEQSAPGNNVPPPIEARAHDLDELVGLPS